MRAWNKIRNLLAGLFCLAALIADGHAEATSMSAYHETLIINGWRLIKPQKVKDTSGKTFVRYSYPDGSYQSYAINPEEKVYARWVKPGVSDYAKVPPGCSVEEIQGLVNWWVKGGQYGDYVVQNGKWVLKPQPPAPPPPLPATASTQTPCVPSGPAAFDGCTKVHLSPVVTQPTK